MMVAAHADGDGECWRMIDGAAGFDESQGGIQENVLALVAPSSSDFVLPLRVVAAFHSSKPQFAKINTGGILVIGNQFPAVVEVEWSGIAPRRLDVTCLRVSLDLKVQLLKAEHVHQNLPHRPLGHA